MLVLLVFEMFINQSDSPNCSFFLKKVFNDNGLPSMAFASTSPHSIIRLKVDYFRIEAIEKVRDKIRYAS